MKVNFNIVKKKNERNIVTGDIIIIRDVGNYIFAPVPFTAEKNFLLNVDFKTYRGQKKYDINLPESEFKRQLINSSHLPYGTTHEDIAIIPGEEVEVTFERIGG
ncbi:MAG: hypothetical protein ACOCRO_05725 [Halanaerobiales bacterium]